MALAARPIVVLIGRLFNRLALDVGIRPRVQLQPIKPDTLFSNGKFPHVWAHGLVKFIPAHAEIAVGLARPDEPGQEWCYQRCAFVCHGYSSALRSSEVWVRVGNGWQNQGTCLAPLESRCKLFVLVVRF